MEHDPQPTVYCALTNGPCDKSFAQPPQGSAFVAYPNIAPIPHDMKETAKKANERGMCVATWEELPPQGRIVFCKICKGILEASELWAEVTHPNQNVYFEVGYAVARRKGFLPLADSTKERGRVEIISTVDTVAYQNSEELLNKIIAFDRDAPLARQCASKEQTASVEDLHVLFLRAEFRTEAAEQVYRELAKSLNPLGVRITVDDPKELAGHSLLEMTTLAATSLFVVVNLAASNRRDSDVANAGASLIAGYAMGRGRRLLVIQEKPADRMLDLRQVAHEYADAKGAVDVVRSWLDRVMPEVKARADEDKVRRDTEEAQLQRWAIDLGALAAEYDSLLRECFLPHEAYQLGLNGQRHLFVGRRGTGKTAMCMQLRSTLEERAGSIVALIAPEDLQVKSMTEKVAGSLEADLDPAVYEAMWGFVLCTEIAAALASYYEQRPHLDDKGVRQKIAEAFDALGCTLREDFDARLLRAIERLPAITQGTGTPRERMLQQFHNREISRLLDLLRSIAEKHEVFVLIDNLDRDWTEDYVGFATGLLNGLLNEAQRLSKKELSGFANVLVFLRTDIYDYISQRDPDTDKKNPLRLKWSTRALFELVTARIRVALHKAGAGGQTEEEGLWNQVFVEAMEDGTPTFDYLVERTMLRPRDLLLFSSRCLDEARQRHHDRVLAEDITVAEIGFSEALFNHLKQEYALGYPDLETIGAELMGSKRMSNRDFMRALARAATNPQLRSYNLQELYGFCYNVGLIGVCISSDVYYSFVNGSYQDVSARVQAAASKGENVSVVVHKGLHRHLRCEY